MVRAAEGRQEPRGEQGTEPSQHVQRLWRRVRLLCLRDREGEGRGQMEGQVGGQTDGGWYVGGKGG